MNECSTLNGLTACYLETNGVGLVKCGESERIGKGSTRPGALSLGLRQLNGLLTGAGRKKLFVREDKLTVFYTANLVWRQLTEHDVTYGFNQSEQDSSPNWPLIV
jgi:hypothetical protein